ncbi:MAG TPA: hypothetical protein VIV27_00245 [Halioglobus sp.]
MINYNGQEIGRMATKSAKPKARAARKSSAKKRSTSGKIAGVDIGKYMEEIKIGKYSWSDMLKSTSKNMDAFAEANRAIIDGYTDIAKRQYEMLKGLLRELRKVRGDRDAIVKELKRVIGHAKRDLQALQKMASKTNSKAQRIVKKRAEANLESWKKMVAEARKSVGDVLPELEKPLTKMKSAAKKAVPKKRKTVARKKAAPTKATGKKVAPKKRSTPKRKTAAKKKASGA